MVASKSILVCRASGSASSAGALAEGEAAAPGRDEELDMNVQAAIGSAQREAETAVEQHMVSAVAGAVLRHEPFDHIYMEHVLSQASYAALLAAMPDRQYYHELVHKDAIRSDGSSTRLRMYLYPELLWRLPNEQRRVWLPVARALCSKQLEDAFKRKFRFALEERFGKWVGRIGLYPVPILIRDQPGYRIGVHADAPTKAITVQFYLPSDDSKRHLGTIFHAGESGEAVEQTVQMPFLPASGYAFPVARTKSWHSAANAGERDSERVSMMVTYYLDESFGDRFTRRLTRAGLLFGIHPRM